MKIKSQFRISIIAFSIILVIVAGSAIFTEQQVVQLNNREAFARDIQTGANDLAYISTNYFLKQDNYSITLWQSRLSSLSDDLSNLNSTNPQQQALASNVDSDLKHLNTVFTGVVMFLENAPLNVSVRVLPQFQTEWSRMSVQTQALAFDAQQLSQYLRGQVDQLNLANIVLVVAFLGLFGAYFITNYLITYRNTLKSISSLQTGLAVIGSGNLDYSLKAGKKDEVGEISRSVNEMTAHLKAVTASKTDLEQARDSLRESEQRWATTLASIGDAVIATDLAGKIAFMNTVAQELTGWTLIEVLKKPVTEIFNIVNEQTHLMVENPVNKVLEKGMIVGLANHTVLIRKDGIEVPIDDSGAPIKDKEGKITGVVLIFRDITPRKTFEMETQRLLGAVQEERDRLSSLLNSINDEVWFADTEKKVTLANPSAIKEFHLSSSDSSIDVENLAAKSEVYRSDGTLRPVEEAPPLRALRGEVLKNQEEIVRTPESGKLRYRQVSSAPVRDKQGNIIGSVSVVRDITDLKELQNRLQAHSENLEKLVEERTRKLEQSSSYARNLIEASLDPLVTINVEGKITDVNKATEEATGCSRQQLIGSDFSDYFTDPEKAKFGYKRVFVEGYVTDYPLAIKHKSGKITDVQYNAVVYRSESGDIQGVFAAARDVTELKKAEVEAQESSKKLKDAERLAAIGATAGMVGHDIRNPLQAITSDIYLVKTDLASFPETEGKKNVQESISEIEKNIYYINKIVADLQDFARPLTPKIEEIDFEKTVHSVLAHLNLPGNVTVKHSIRKDFPKLKADPTYIQRILTNLSNNALQAMPNGGKLTITAVAKNGKAIISIEDNGEGIPESIRSKLFTPLVTTKSKGQGFGLSVVKRFTEALGGTVKFETEVGKGTKFTIELPIY